MWRSLPFASLYAAFHRRSRLDHDTPQNLDDVAVGAREVKRESTLFYEMFHRYERLQRLWDGNEDQEYVQNLASTRGSLAGS